MSLVVLHIASQQIKLDSKKERNKKEQLEPAKRKRKKEKTAKGK
jgi:hypothetical protein